MSEPIRILQVFAQMNRGGAETMIMNLYRNIDRSKVQFDFIVHTEEKCAFDEEIEQLGGRIYKIPRYTGVNHFNYVKVWKDFFEEHTDHKIIHGHLRSTASIYLYIARNFNLKTIAHSHSTSSRGNALHKIVKRIMQLPIRYIVDYMFACSNEAGKWLFGERSKNGNRFKLLKNAIDIDKYLYNEKIRNAVREEFHISENFVIGHIGSFSHPKNHKFLVDIFYEVRKERSDAILMLVGDGELLTDIKMKISRLGIEDNVVFTGVRSDVPKLLQGMDMIVFPSIYEGLPVTIIESQAAGLKSIISDSITNEVMITSLVERLSLSLDASIWAQRVLENVNLQERKAYKNEIEHSGYDIMKTSKEYQDFCIGLYKSSF